MSPSFQLLSFFLTLVSDTCLFRLLLGIAAGCGGACSGRAGLRAGRFSACFVPLSSRVALQNAGQGPNLPMRHQAAQHGQLSGVQVVNALPGARHVLISCRRLPHAHTAPTRPRLTPPAASLRDALLLAPGLFQVAAVSL